jgi:Uma2 family endonuclease
MSGTRVGTSSIKTMADALKRLGDAPLDRIRFRPAPGTATVQDVITVREREGRLCELVEGVLLEKAVGYTESRLALFLAGLLNAFVIPRNLGIVAGPDGTVELMLVRIPDVSFTSWDRLPGRRSPAAAVPRMAPDVVVEILSRGNTPGEMAAKRQEYFEAGVLLVWDIDPRGRTVQVYTSPTAMTTLGMTDRLEGGSVLPGFTLPLTALFAGLDRQGPTAGASQPAP